MLVTVNHALQWPTDSRIYHYLPLCAFRHATLSSLPLRWYLHTMCGTVTVIQSFRLEGCIGSLSYPVYLRQLPRLSRLQLLGRVDRTWAGSDAYPIQPFSFQAWLRLCVAVTTTKKRRGKSKCHPIIERTETADRKIINLLQQQGRKRCCGMIGQNFLSWPSCHFC